LGVPLHTALWQSAVALQSLLSTHLVHDPPQSTSDSVPFRITSLQLAAAHVFGLPVQTPSRQSAATEHFLLVPQSAQETLPPQSTSVSTPFVVLSLQAGT
jgi:hypothetical protein